MAAQLASVWLQELTWEDVGAYLEDSDIIICPVGSTEEHGPAGPLGLDCLIAIALAEDVARATGTLCTPPLWFGDSPHHLGFPGTISLRTETLMAVIQDMSRSLAKHGFRKILIINGHKGANLPGLLAATKNLREYEMPEVFFAVIDPVKIAKKIANEIKEATEHHSGELEISECWYKYPHLIKQEKLTTSQVDFEENFSPWSHGDLFSAPHEVIDIPWTSAEQRRIAPTGSFSPSIKASPEKGKAYHDYMVDQIVQFIGWLRAYKGPWLRFDTRGRGRSTKPGRHRATGAYVGICTPRAGRSISSAPPTSRWRASTTCARPSNSWSPTPFAWSCARPGTRRSPGPMRGRGWMSSRSSRRARRSSC